MADKPTHAKPSLYAYYFIYLKDIAVKFGYNLVLHGSLNRDLDLIAIPWVDNPKPEINLIKALSKHLGGKMMIKHNRTYSSSLPGGRTNYIINLNRGGYRRNMKGTIIDPIDFTPDVEYYLDISVTPLVIKK